MKKTRLFAALCALMLTMGLAGCKQESENSPTTPTAPTENPTPEYTGLTEQDAQALVDEKLPEGYTSEANGMLDKDENGNTHYLFRVFDGDKQEVGQVAIDKESGERHSYDGEKLLPYSDFVLYDPSVDAVIDWNGKYTNGEFTLELIQEDGHSFWFLFSDSGPEDVAQVTGNTAAYADGKLTFTMQEDGSLVVGGTETAFTGTYQPEET